MRPVFQRLFRSWRAWHVRKVGVSLGAECQIEAGVVCDPGYRERNGRIIVGSQCVLGHGVILHAWGGSIGIGDHVFLGPYTVIYGQGGVEIGADSLISMHCRILSSNHAIPPRGAAIRWQPDTLQPTRIGRDVWLGAGVTVLGSVTIGDGCIVGAGAVVSSDLPPYSISMGVPAKVVRERDKS